MVKILTVGLLMVLVGVVLVITGAAIQGNVSTGGVVFFGPFPIVFGTGPGGAQLALLSVVIGAVIMALLFLWGWRLSHSSGSMNEESIK